MKIKSYIILLLVAVGCSNFIYSDLLTLAPCKTNADCPVGASCWPAGFIVDGRVLDKSVCSPQATTYAGCNPPCQGDQVCFPPAYDMNGKIVHKSNCGPRPSPCSVFQEAGGGPVYQMGCAEGQMCNSFKKTCVPKSDLNG